MKIALLLLSLLLIAPTLRAEDAAVSAETQATEAAAAAERQKKLQAEEKAKVEKEKVTYSGFLHEASKAPDKKKFFSLRQPRAPQRDIENISFDERTGRPRGFVLFRISPPNK